MRKLSVALVHHPVLDAGGAVATSTMTTIDVHDLSRSARTYGAEALYIVHPIPAQQELAHKIVDHWTHGSSAKRIPDRKDALAIVRVNAGVTLEETRAACGEGTEMWATAEQRGGFTLDGVERRASALGVGGSARPARLRDELGPRAVRHRFGGRPHRARSTAQATGTTSACAQPARSRSTDWPGLL